MSAQPSDPSKTTPMEKTGQPETPNQDDQNTRIDQLFQDAIRDLQALKQPRRKTGGPGGAA